MRPFNFFSVHMELGTARCQNFCMFKVILCEQEPIIAKFFNCSIICRVRERSRGTSVRKKVKENGHTFPKISVLRRLQGVYIVYITESVVNKLIFRSCLCQNPNEQGTTE